MQIGVIAFSKIGMTLATRLAVAFTEAGEEALASRCPEGGLSVWVQAHFISDDALVFIGSCGIAVRGIAPYLKSKTTDPAVVVVDECGMFAVSLLSGHIGGANALTKRIADLLRAIPVVTTATDRNGLFAIDAWAATQGLWIANPERIKWVSAKLLAGEPVRVKSLFPIAGRLPECFAESNDAPDVLISYRTRGRADALKLVPRIVTLGVGCRRDTPAEAIEEAFALVLKKASCYAEAVSGAYSIDRKQNEAGIIAFCKRHNLPYQTFPAQALVAVPGHFTTSSFVQSVTGVDNVCERSAVLGAGAGGRLLTQKQAEHGVTMALAMKPYTVRFLEDMP